MKNKKEKTYETTRFVEHASLFLVKSLRKSYGITALSHCNYTMV